MSCTRNRNLGDSMNWPTFRGTSTQLRSTRPTTVPPRPETARKWVESVNENTRFKFSAKLFHSFTHERNPASNDEREFKEGIAPLIEAGRFGALLIQFPRSFKSSRDNREYLIALQKRFSEYPLVVEVRHASWLDEKILDLLSELGVGICNIDQPLFRRSVQPRHMSLQHPSRSPSWFQTLIRPEKKQITGKKGTKFSSSSRV